LGILVLIGVFLLMALGLVGTFLPILPGTGLIFLGVLLYGFYDHFQVVTGPFVALMLALTILAVVTDYLAGALGAKRVKASRAGVLGATLGGIVGVFAFGPPGLLVGPFLGAVTGEVAAGCSARQAFRVGFASVLGAAGGVLVKVLIGVTMIIMFIFRVT
jgi:uncharacterized protein YqgC (DUF456 family)